MFSFVVQVPLYQIEKAPFRLEQRLLNIRFLLLPSLREGLGVGFTSACTSFHS